MPLSEISVGKKKCLFLPDARVAMDSIRVEIDKGVIEFKKQKDDVASVSFLSHLLKFFLFSEISF